MPPTPMRSVMPSGPPCRLNASQCLESDTILMATPPQVPVRLPRSNCPLSVTYGVLLHGGPVRQQRRWRLHPGADVFPAQLSVQRRCHRHRHGRQRQKDQRRSSYRRGLLRQLHPDLILHHHNRPYPVTKSGAHHNRYYAVADSIAHHSRSYPVTKSSAYHNRPYSVADSIAHHNRSYSVT